MDETDKIMKAQSARGADMNQASIIKRAKNAMVPILIPLFVCAFKRAVFATAMEVTMLRGG